MLLSSTEHRRAKERKEREAVLEEELCSPMISAVCSISLISPVGVPSPLHAADQFPLHTFGLYLSVCRGGRARVCRYAS